MKGYPLARLLSLRIRKEGLARAEVAKHRRLVEEARERAEKAERIAREFAQQRPAREAALFEAIRNQVLERGRLDRYHEDIAALAARELELFELAGEEREKVRQAEELLARAVRDHQECLRDVRKFEEHRDIWALEEKRRLEEAQELEAEETAGIAAMRREKP